MNRMRYPIVLLSAAVLSTADAAPAKPDVLFILTDQWSPRCVSWDDPQVVTPHLDRIARDGMIFDCCYTAGPVCVPSRVSLLTGRYPHNHGVFGNPNNHHLPAAQAPMFRDIRAAGYTTAQIGKLHWFNGASWKKDYKTLDDYHRAMGLDHCEDIEEPYSVSHDRSAYGRRLRELGLLDACIKDMTERLLRDQYLVRPSVVPPEHHNDSFVADAAIEFIRKQPAGKSFCLVVSFPGPHPPLDAPGKYATMFDPEKIKLPPNVPETFNYDSKVRTCADARRMWANYLGKLALLDDNFGRLADALRQRGTWDNTLVIFSADHGEMLGAHGALSKGRMWEESARVPLVARWPGRVKPGRTQALVQMFDIYPTIVEAAGGQLSPGHFARSFLPVATGAATKTRDAVLSEVGREPPLDFMLRTPRHKWWVSKRADYLFDMETDPFEQTNLAAAPEHRETLRQMRDQMLQQLMLTQVSLAAGSKSKVQRAREAAGAKSDARATTTKR